MGSDIVSDAREVVAATRALLEKPAPKQADALLLNLELLQRQISEIVGAAKKIRQPNRRVQGIRDLRKVTLPAESLPAAASAPASRAVADSEPRETVEVESFFAQVSDSLIKTQSRLNDLSLDYVRGLDPRIAPAYYAIPSLKAEMKVGFQSVDSKRLNLVLFSREREKRDYGESTVTLELVAAPPPPGEAPYGELNVPTPRFLILGEERSRLLGAARRLADAEGKKLGKTFDKTEQSELALVLLFEPAPGERAQGSARYLVVWPSQQAMTRDAAKWRELLVMPLVEDSSGVRIDSDFPFESGAPFLVASAARSPGNDSATLAADLGDALNHVAIAIRDWAEAVRPPRLSVAKS